MVRFITSCAGATDQHYALRATNKKAIIRGTDPHPGGSREQFAYDPVGNPVGYTTRAGEVRMSVFGKRPAKHPLR